MKQYKWHLVWIIFLAACSGREQNTQNQVSSPIQNESPAKVVYYIDNVDNEAVGSVEQGESISLTFGDESLFRVCNSQDKCKYRNRDGMNRYEIKYSEQGFKLRTETGELIWKIKFTEDKIKLARNEEMDDAIEIKSNAGTAKISQDGEEIGRVDFGSGSIPVLAEGPGGKVFITGPERQMASGILILEDIPVDQKLILFAESLR